MEAAPLTIWWAGNLFSCPPCSWCEQHTPIIFHSVSLKMLSGVMFGRHKGTNHHKEMKPRMNTQQHKHNNCWMRFSRLEEKCDFKVNYPKAQTYLFAVSLQTLQRDHCFFTRMMFTLRRDWVRDRVTGAVFCKQPNTPDPTHIEHPPAFHHL